MRPSATWPDAPKQMLDGTHRARALEATWAWLAPKGRQIGVTRVANVTGLDAVGIPVWTSVRPNARGLSVSQGKGASHLAARISALMESIENWHAETIDAPVRIADYATLRATSAAVAPRQLSHWADAPMRDDVAIAWIEGEEPLTGTRRWVPFETVSTDYVLRAEQHAPLSSFVQSSNGLAGGNSHWEASCHAVAELIERHTIWANEERIRRFAPEIRVDPETVTDAQCRWLLGRLHQAGLMVALFMLPSDLDPAGRDLPVAACSIVEADATARWRNLPPFNGYGCHLDPPVALSRAITEAAQSRLTYIVGGRDDISAQEYRQGGHPDDLDAYRALFRRSHATLDFRRIGGGAGPCFRADFETMAARLAAAGYDQPVIVDLARSEVEVPVVKAVIPGLAVPGSLVGGRPIAQPSTLRREAA